MKFKMYLFMLCLLSLRLASAQNSDGKTSTQSKKDSIRLAKYKAKGIYPVIKSCPFSGVLPFDGVTEKPDSTLKYKLVFSLTTGAKDAEKAKELNRGLAEIGRIINLHIAAGVPKANLDVVIVTHGLAMYTLLKNEAYKKEFKTDNPNLTIVGELEKADAKFVACSQAMQFLEIDKKDLDQNVKIALAAKVALSTYQLKGYTLYKIDEE